ncbi:fimbrial biogenesis chaperone [Pseudomonas lundensis]|uniref:fimbrial biogenesis chaperone n=1 Tax=Pseudomonas lundensis TaxID=86185 RepID=UPI000BA1D2B7|nr:molecular chaperone [Pseudomonas lundensis]OZY45629.1 molecular chaperone [Pseudomonas lundensis]
MTQKITLILTRLMLIGLLFVFIFPAQAGVMASRTRVIYEQGQTERSLMLANINPYPVVVQTWVNDGEDQQAPEKSTSPMIALPSVFRMQPGAVQGLRILYNGDALPKDRESVFWLNLYEIAPKSGATPAPEAAVALAMNTQMKIFYRPKNLPSTPDEMPAKLTFTLEQQGEHWVLVLRNPTPYHASMASLRLVDRHQEMAVPQTLDMMAPPFGEKRYPMASGSQINPQGLNVSFTWVDDGGHFHTGTAPVLHP